MIFELPIYDISQVLNFQRAAHEGQLPPNGVTGWVGERDWIDAADHLIFNMHHLFTLNLVKKIL